MLAEYEINRYDLYEFAINGELDKIIYICGYLDKNGKNAKYNIDIAGSFFNLDLDKYLIYFAYINGNIKIVKYFMKNWSHLIDITARDNFAIHFACLNGNILVIKYLIAVCLREILDWGLYTYDINKIIN